MQNRFKLATLGLLSIFVIKLYDLVKSRFSSIEIGEMHLEISSIDNSEDDLFDRALAKAPFNKSLISSSTWLKAKLAEIQLLLGVSLFRLSTTLFVVMKSKFSSKGFDTKFSSSNCCLLTSLIRF